MKSKIIGIFALLLIITMVAIPTFAATSSYSFNINYKVSGKDKDNFHYLNSGKVYLSGYAFYNGNHEPGAIDSEKGETVEYRLYKDDAWADTYYGQISHYVSDYADAWEVDRISSSFPKNVGSNSGKYYLVVEKEMNGWKMIGSGTLRQ